jgi:phosphoribosylamine---glycine ligase
MKILIIGSGGREHALAWKLSQSEKVEKIFTAPGNGGTARLGENVAIKARDIKDLVDFALSRKIDLTVVGPEDPLSLGIVDAFLKKGLLIFGPVKKSAKLESSKVFSKRFMKKFNIPTADFKVFNSFKKALAFIKKRSYPLVLKADGLSAGKGVFVCQNKKEAKKALEKIMVKKTFNEAGSRVVVEDCLSGFEVSVICFTDGKKVLPLLSAQDHKAVFNNDKGPNTGGMGAYAPTPLVTKKLMTEISETILKPAVLNMKKLGMSYQGILYAGLMLTSSGPKVLEFNCRFGDPETQPQLMLLKTDLLKLMLECAKGNLKTKKLLWHKGYSVCVVLASKGYPLNYNTGFIIKGLPKKSLADLVVFQSGTKFKKGKLITSGGRVLGITSRSKSLSKAIKKAYNWAEKIKFKNKYYRTDIGQRPEIKPWLIK